MNTIRRYMALLPLLASLCWGQSMFSTKNQLANNGWNKPTVDSIFNHALTTNEKQNVWFSIPGNATWISANAGKVVAVDPSCNAYIYTDGKANSWTKYPAWGCVKEVSIDYDGNLYGLVNYNSAGKGYYLSKRVGSGWSNLSCCFQSFRMRRGVMAAYDINGTIWTSTNYGATVKSQAWCAPDGPAAVAPAGVDQNGNARLYVACTSGQIWHFDGSNWYQLPGSGTEIAVSTSGEPYIVSSNGNVQHWNGGGWDDMVTNKPVKNLSVGDPFNVWMVGPAAPSGSVIWRTWENGVVFTHSYGGSVTCGQGVPAALCGTFTHKVNHQICYGAHCGSVSQSGWDGQGSWGPDANVFATPYDLWTCLLAGEPAGPCDVAENEASMECSGGGSNSDNAPSLNWIVGDSIDILDYSYNIDHYGPMNVTTGVGMGYVLGQVDNQVHDGCRVSDPVPVCPQGSPLTIHDKVLWWGGVQGHAEALFIWNDQQDAHVSGASAPYVSHSFYIGQADASGTLIQGTQQCFGGFLGTTDFLNGNYDVAPPCK